MTRRPRKPRPVRTTGQRIKDYVEAYWERHDRDTFPPVRKVAAALGLSQRVVYDTADGHDDLVLTRDNNAGAYGPGDWDVETV